MNNLLVYQFSYGQIGQYFGYIFPSENIESSDQNLFFALALPRHLDRGRSGESILKFLKESYIYMACDTVNGQINLQGNFDDFPVVSFPIVDSVVDDEARVNFEIDVLQLFNPYDTLTYIGNYYSLLPNDHYLVPIFPKNIKMMNELYIATRFAFVGATPLFGKFRDFTRYQ